MANGSSVEIWVVADKLTEGCLELLGDARRTADRLNARVGVLLLESNHSLNETKTPTTSKTWRRILGLECSTHLA